MDGFTTARLFPVGNVSNYLPVTLTPTSAMDFGVSVFTGITEDGTVTGTAFTPIKKSGVVDAVWNLARITGTGDCSIDVNWPAGLEGTAFSTFADAEIGIGHHDGVNWGLVIGSGNNSSNTASAVFSTFSPFAVGRAGTLLPVKLLNTSAMVINNNVTVQWDAQNETDISYYRIQRSGDGVHFSNTGTITARNNLALINQYSYTDAGLAAGIYFYRLVSIGKNNNSSYSNIMRVAVQVKISVNAYPNPVTEVLNISGIQKDDLLKLININGAVVRTSTAAGNTGTIDVQQLPTGNYTLQVYRSTTVLTSVTVIKN
jgi:hypothetical protein